MVILNEPTNEPYYGGTIIITDSRMHIEAEQQNTRILADWSYARLR